MDESGRDMICRAPNTLTVKRLMMMMVMMVVIVIMMIIIVMIKTKILTKYLLVHRREY